MRTIVFTCLLTLASAALAQESNLTGPRSTFETSLQWNLDPAYWDRLIAEQRESPLRIGRTDFVISGPLIDGVRPRRTSEDLTLGQKIARFPLIRLFIPGPMPNPPPAGTGRYFAWRSESPRPWANVSTAGGAASGAYDPTRQGQGQREAGGGLITVSW